MTTTPDDTITAGTITFGSGDGTPIEGYLATPASPRGGGVVVIHHLPGYDYGTKEITRRLATWGYSALLVNLYSRDAPGASPDDAAAAVRAAGGVPDERVVTDVDGAAAHLRSLPGANGKVGVIGFCSGGRQSFLSAVSLPLDAAVDCYGAFIVNEPPAEFPLKARPLLGRAGDLSCPLLGLFGVQDSHPSPAETAVLAAELERLGKPHEFHTLDDAGHGFFAADRPSYRQAAAVAGWELVHDFYDRTLS